MNNVYLKQRKEKRSMPIQTLPALPVGDDLRECYAERAFSDTCRSATFQSIAEHFGIPSHMAVSTPKGKNMTLHASDIWAARKKFFAHVELDQQSCRLTVS